MSMSKIAKVIEENTENSVKFYERLHETSKYVSNFGLMTETKH